jgi:hypothetical protein
MSDIDKIREHLAGLAADGVISDACARVIASQWHRGQSSALYALSSSGALVPGAVSEVGDALDGDNPAKGTDNRRALAALRHYIAARWRDGKTYAVAGWSDLQL